MRGFQNEHLLAIQKKTKLKTSSMNKHKRRNKGL